MTRRLGFLVNPVAGMGGSVGLKGTDGRLAAKARALGAVPQAPERARRVLQVLRGHCPDLALVTADGAMGAKPATTAGFEPEVAYRPSSARTTGDDTRRAATAILDAGVELLLFAGGDGTARDLLAAVDRQVPMLGIPCGVKMHSAVFAASPRTAADVVRAFLRAEHPSALLRDAEVMDREQPDGAEPGSPALFGFARIPRLAHLVTPAKAGPGEEPMLAGACRQVSQLVRADERISLIGPGSTMQRIKSELGIPGTLLGVDAVIGGRLLGADMGERAILDLVGQGPARVVVGVVGGQGFLFGRGNQQLSARVIRDVGVENIVIVASAEKLAAIPGGCLLVDTGDESLDEELSGWRSVITGAGRTALVRVRAAATAGMAGS